MRIGRTLASKKANSSASPATAKLAKRKLERIIIVFIVIRMVGLYSK
jgi:hypothetical protein